MTKLLKYQNQAPRFFWLMSFFPAALGQETIVKKKGFRHLTKKKVFSTKIENPGPCNIYLTPFITSDKYRI